MLKCAGIERSLIVPVLLTLIFIVGCEPVARPKEYVSATELRLRAEASQKGSTLEVLKFGAEVEVLSVSAENETINGITAPWKQVRYGDKEGWVFGGYLSASKPAASPAIRALLLQFPALTLSLHPTDSSWRIFAEDNDLYCTNQYAEGCSVDEVTQDGSLFRFRGSVVFAGEQPVNETWTCFFDRSAEPLFCKGGIDGSPLIK